MTDRAKCGCVPGEFLCPEAVRLWAEVNVYTYRKPGDEKYEQYMAARAAYDEHMTKARKEMRCSSPRS